MLNSSVIAKYLWEMLVVYVSVAWPFSIIHCVPLLAINFGPLRRMLHETAAPLVWPYSPAGSAAASILSQFEEEESFGQRGLRVSMTNGTDRLDSEVIDLIESMHNRANLLRAQDCV